MRLLLLCALLPALTAPPSALTAPPSVRVTVEPAALAVTTGQCNARDLGVRLTNTGPSAVYADATLTAPPALHLQRTLVSTWIPAGHTRSVPVRVRAATGTPAGTYRVTVAGRAESRTVPVTVTAPPADAPLARRAATASASSFRALGPICAGADGDPATFWADATNRSWPDWHQLTWPAAERISRVEVVTVPAAQGGLRDWDVQTWTGAAWTTAATVRGNTATARTSTFPARATTSLRIVTRAANGLDDQSRIAEVRPTG